MARRRPTLRSSGCVYGILHTCTFSLSLSWIDIQIHIDSFFNFLLFCFYYSTHYTKLRHGLINKCDELRNDSVIGICEERLIKSVRTAREGLLGVSEAMRDKRGNGECGEGVSGEEGESARLLASAFITDGVEEGVCDRGVRVSVGSS